MRSEDRWGRHWGRRGGWGRQWEGWMPWGQWSRFFSPGELRLALLSLLEERPKHGYELMKNLEARSGGAYRASAGSVYPTLQQLEDEGFVSCETVDGKRVYSLTDEARAELAREAETVKRIWHRADGMSGWAECMGPEIASIAGPIARLVKSAFRAVSSANYDDARVAAVREILNRATEELERAAQSAAKA